MRLYRTHILIALCLSAMGDIVGPRPPLRIENPQVGSSKDLRVDIASEELLTHLLESYKIERRERLEQHELAPLHQEDIDKLHNFAVDNKNFEASLTAKLVIPLVILRDGYRHDCPDAIKIVEDVARNYPDRWQGIVAKVFATAMKEAMNKNFGSSRELLEAQRQSLGQALAHAPDMDAIDTQLFRLVREVATGFSNETYQTSFLAYLGHVNEGLGDYDEARQNYERIMEVTSDPKVQRRAKIDLDNIERRKREAEAERQLQQEKKLKEEELRNEIAAQNTRANRLVWFKALTTLAVGLLMLGLIRFYRSRRSSREM